MYRNPILLIPLFIALVIDIAAVFYIINLKNENTELKKLIPQTTYTVDYGFGKVYKIQKSTVDSIPNNTFFFSKDNQTIYINSEQENGSILKYEVFISDKPLTDSILTELTPIIINAIKATEKEIKEKYKKKSDYDRIKENFIKSGHIERL